MRTKSSNTFDVGQMRRSRGISMKTRRSPQTLITRQITALHKEGDKRVNKQADYREDDEKRKAEDVRNT